MKIQREFKRKNRNRFLFGYVRMCNTVCVCVGRVFYVRKGQNVNEPYLGQWIKTLTVLLLQFNSYLFYVGVYVYPKPNYFILVKHIICYAENLISNINAHN